MARHATYSADDAVEFTDETSEAMDGPGRRQSHPHARHNYESHQDTFEPPTIQTVAYLDGSVLRRPLDPPSNVMKFTVLFVLIAAIIGGFFIMKWLDVVIGSPQAEAEALHENLERDSPLEPPALAQLILLDNGQILAKLDEAGFTIYNRTSEKEAESGDLSLVKLPKDVDATDAAVLYSSDIKNLSASKAVYLLNGAWTLDVTRGDPSTLLRLRYADFKSETAEAAILNAIEAEGLDPATATESGKDDSGNTFQKGSIVTDAGTFNWGVYACPLSDVYDVSGLPETAQFIGIRYSSQ